MTTTVKQTVKNVLRTARIHSRLNDAGIVVKLEEKRTYSNLRFNCGRLVDGKVSRSYRLEVSGNTWQMRDLLKGAGFRWDPKAKVWHAAPKTKTGTLCAAMVRRLAN